MNPGVDVGRVSLQKMAKLNHYGDWLYQNIEPFVGRRVLEVGCGLGNMTRYFLRSELVLATDCSKRYVEEVRLKFGGMESFEALVYDTEDEGTAEFSGYQIDTVICISVLEHIRDDLRALRNMARILREDGRLILVVPSFGWLFGSLDRAAGHYRRYDQKDLRERIVQSGLVLERLFYMNFVGIFGWYLNYRVLNKRVPPDRQSSLFDKLVPFFASVERVFRPPVGLSMVCVCRKRGERL